MLEMVAIAGINMAGILIGDIAILRGVAILVQAAVLSALLVFTFQVIDPRPAVIVGDDGVTVIGIFRPLHLPWSDVTEIGEIERYGRARNLAVERFFVAGRGHRVPIVDKPAGGTLADLRHAMVSARDHAVS